MVSIKLGRSGFASQLFCESVILIQLAIFSFHKLSDFGLQFLIGKTRELNSVISSVSHSSSLKVRLVEASQLLPCHLQTASSVIEQSTLSCWQLRRKKRKNFKHLTRAWFKGNSPWGKHDHTIFPKEHNTLTLRALTHVLST